MKASKYKQRFKKLLKFSPNLISDEVSKKRRFFNSLSEPLTLSISGAIHPTYQSIKYVALEIERQTFIMCRTKCQSFDDMPLGNLSQGSFKNDSFNSRSLGNERSRGGRHNPMDSGFQRWTYLGFWTSVSE